MTLPAAEEYARRRDAMAGEEARFSRSDAWIATLRGLLFLGGALLLAVIWKTGTPSWYWLLGPGLLFVAAVIAHDIILRRKLLAARGKRFYRDGLERLAGRWTGRRAVGERYRDPRHPYANDLDLFGEGSLFALLCHCATRLGEDQLAHWLTHFPSREIVLSRQAAVDELRSHYHLRELVGLSYEEEFSEANQNLLRAWSGTTARPVAPMVKLTAAALGITFWSCVLSWVAGLVPWSLILVPYISCVSLALYFRFRILDTSQAIDRADSGLRPLLRLLKLIEQQQFQSELLNSITLRLQSAGQPASMAIDRLHRLSLGFDAIMRNQFVAPLAPTLGLNVLLFDRAERWRQQHGHNVPGWFEAVGEFEALLSLSTYAIEHPAHPWPTIEANGPVFEAKALGHPLLSQDRCVRNDLKFGREVQLLVISGSNMAGKSTLLRSVGVNAVLALTGAPVCAKALTISILHLGSVLRTVDSLRDGKSLFFAALERLKLVATLADNQPPVLFLLDELLAGTNSHDRRIGAEAVIRRLLAAGAFGIVTTHDLALTEIAEKLAPRATNLHFRDVLVGGTLQFDHTLRPGIVDRGNALALMRGLGLIADDTQN